MPSSRRDMIVGTAGAAMLTSSASAADSAHKAPLMTFAFAAKVSLSPAVEHGVIDGVRKRFIAITGGTISGPKLVGKILPGGGDWQNIHEDGLTSLDARYAFEASDGTVIRVFNSGVRVAAPDIIKRLAAGEDVDPALYYFRTTCVFDVTKGPHDWLRRQIFVCRGIRRPDHVLIEFFEVG
jgi:Protein of unknown function (DUF3237)